MRNRQSRYKWYQKSGFPVTTTTGIIPVSPAQPATTALSVFSVCPLFPVIRPVIVRIIIV